MAAIIIVMPKSGGNQQKVQEYWQIIDQYITSQGMTVIDSAPKSYFSDKSIPPNKIKQLVDVIKNTDGYKMACQCIFHTANLAKS